VNYNGVLVGSWWFNVKDKAHDEAERMKRRERSEVRERGEQFAVDGVGST
jgi:hypothetical protein